MRLFFSISIAIFHATFCLHEILLYISNKSELNHIYEQIPISLLLASISIYDVYSMRIGKYLVETAFFLIILFGLVNKSYLLNEIIVSKIIGTLVIYICMKLVAFTTYKATHREVLGLGDAKVAALGGALLGLEGGITDLSTAFITAGMFTISGRALSKLKPWQAFPFSPFICFGIEIIWNLGNYFYFVDLFVG